MGVRSLTRGADQVSVYPSVAIDRWNPALRREGVGLSNGAMAANYSRPEILPARGERFATTHWSIVLNGPQQSIAGSQSIAGHLV